MPVRFSYSKIFMGSTMREYLFKSYTAGLLLLSLAACSSTPPVPQNPNDGRYSITQDRAPDRAMNIASIPEVIPEPITRTGAGNRSPYSVLGNSYNVLSTEEGYRETGVASWYGEKFHGHKTSNGETFDMYLASAAHKSLPIPSFLRVTNLDNNRSLVVRVNDRGPFHGDRIVDLSFAAASKLGYADRGTARVLLESVVVHGDDRAVSRRDIPVNEVLARSASGNKFLQVGAFSELGTAQQVSSKLEGLTSFPVIIRSVNTAGNGILHRVRVGPISDPGQIRRITQSVVAANLGSPYTVTE